MRVVPTPPRVRIEWPSSVNESQDSDKIVRARRRNTLVWLQHHFHDLDDRGSLYVVDPDSRLGRGLYWTASAFSLYTVFAEPYLLASAQYTSDWSRQAPAFFVALSVAAEIFFFIDLLFS